MSDIKVLPDEVVNKIAAGEVVERPSSVVKELLENSIDAGANKIKVELVEGGTKSIVISDNGKGIRAEDISLTVCRHATSKIESASDLFSINTMGFRGEALAAISSVSKFKIKSRHKDELKGAMLTISNESELISPSIDEYDGAVGTTIMVDELFYNVPARSKFLKRASTEYAHILELTQALSLSYPHIDFSLVHNTKEVFRAYPVEGAKSGEVTEASLRERAYRSLST
jgi:DNA mismatch repair protein MutL